jgi:hypothetical protein
MERKIADSEKGIHTFDGSIVLISIDPCDVFALVRRE